MKTVELSKSDVKLIGLIMQYGGVKVTLSVGAKILCRSPDYFAAYLHEHGVTIEALGTRKLVRLEDLVRLSDDRSEDISPIRNDRKGA